MACNIKRSQIITLPAGSVRIDAPKPVSTTSGAGRRPLRNNKFTHPPPTAHQPNQCEPRRRPSPGSHHCARVRQAPRRPTQDVSSTECDDTRTQSVMLATSPTRLMATVRQPARANCRKRANLQWQVRASVLAYYFKKTKNNNKKRRPFVFVSLSLSLSALT